MIETTWGSATDVGRVRQINEDSWLAQPPVFLVADGMGGHAAGDVASAIVKEEFSTTVGDDEVTAEWVIDRFALADQRIRGGKGGGTTVAGAALVTEAGEPYWLIFNIGDSRVYHRQEGTLRQRSVDHSVIQELIDNGEVSSDGARFHPQRHVITRAVGLAEGPRPDFWLVPAVDGDRLLMCSDGLTSELDESEIQRLGCAELTPQEVARSLVDAAVEAGGRDNVTVVVVDVHRRTGGGRHATEDEQAAVAVPDEMTMPRRFDLPFAVSGAEE